MEKKLNLKEKIYNRMIPIFKMKEFTDEDRTLALECIYEDFVKQGYERHVISTLISVCVLEKMTRSQDALNKLIKELGK